MRNSSGCCENDTRRNATGQKVSVVGSNRFRDFSLTNPFLLPNHSGVRYYANEDLTGGHLSSMLTNAQKTSEYITDYLVPRKNGKYLPAITEIMALEDEHHATLASRREFLENFIAKLCDEIYGSENESLLPAFAPVELKPVKELAEGETYKKAPIHVAQNMLKGLEGDRHGLSVPAGSRAREQIRRGIPRIVRAHLVLLRRPRADDSGTHDDPPGLHARDSANIVDQESAQDQAACLQAAR